VAFADVPGERADGRRDCDGGRGGAGRWEGLDSESKEAASERARADRTRSKSEMTRRRDGARARTRRRRRVQLRRREEVLLRPDVHELRAEVGGDVRTRDRQPRKEDAETSRIEEDGDGREPRERRKKCLSSRERIGRARARDAPPRPWTAADRRSPSPWGCP
jgi:hypothetical protein